MDPNSLDGEALVAAHKSTTLKLRLLAVAFPVVVIGVVVFYLTSIAGQIRAVDTTAVATETAQRLGAAWPELEGHLSDVAKKVEPALTKALGTQAEAMGPLIEERLQKDVERTVKAVEKSFSAAVETAIVSMEEKQRVTLRKAVPELAGSQVAEERVLGAARQTIAEWSSSRFHTAMEEHVAAMDSIRRTLKSGYSSDQAGDPSEALMAWLQLLNAQVGGENLVAVAPEAKPAKTAKATKAKKAEGKVGGRHE